MTASQSTQARPRLSPQRLGLGTVQFGLPYGVSNTGGQVAEDEARAIVALALEAGMTVIDTAAAYGTSEQVVADVLPRATGSAAAPRIVTKTLPLRSSGSLAATIDRLEGSLATFAVVGGVDTVLVHDASDFLGRDGTALWQHLYALKSSGKINKIGISAYHRDRPADLAVRFSPDVMQLPVSLLDQRLVADGTLARLAELGVEIHARSLFLQGLLFLGHERLPPKLAHAAGAIARALTVIADSGATPIEAALAYVLSRPEIAKGIVGVTTTAELDGILEACNRPALRTVDWAACAIDDAVVLDPSAW